MKNLLKNIRSNLIFLLIWPLLSANAVWAKPKILVNAISGNVFALKKGKIWKPKAGEYLEDFTELMTEIGAQVSFSDFFDHSYHLAGSGHVKVLNKVLELKRGYLWAQSQNRGNPFFLHTANSVTEYQKGEFILSYDSVNGKSQLFTISGKPTFSNILGPHSKITLLPGQFSFVSNDYNEGVPRNGTQIGNASYHKMVALFDDVSPMRSENERFFRKRMPKDRVPASMGMPTQKQTKRMMDDVREEPKKMNSKASIKGEGKIIFLKKPKKRVAFDLKNFYGEDLQKVEDQKKKRKSIFDQKSGVPIRIFGPARNKRISRKARKKVIKKVTMPQEIEKNRVPASTPKKMRNNAYDKSFRQFEKTLGEKQKKHSRHSEEVTRLIEELESFDQDYQQNY